LRLIRLVLVEPEGKINFGFILRLAKNFNVYDICVVRPKFNLADDEVLRFAAGGAEMVKYCKVCENLKGCLEDVRLSVCTTAIAGSEDDVLRQAVPITTIRYMLPSEGVIALVFGRESVGLTRDELSECDMVSTIPLKSEYNVMNLSHAVALYLYELTLARVVTPEDRVTIGKECNEATFRALLKLINEVGTLLGESIDTYVALKHVLARASLTKPECGTLYRFFKRLAYVIRTFHSIRKYDEDLIK